MHVPGRVSLSLSGLPLRPGTAWGGTARGVLEWACSVGYRWVQIDAAMAGLRPRELDASARREIVTMLRRRGAGISGLDLLIPSAHFADPAHADRAASAVRDAISLAGEWGDRGARLSVTIALPAGKPGAIAADLCTHAERVGAVIADCACPPNATPGMAVAVDPPAVLASGTDLVASITRLASAPASARLSDLDAGGRVEAGTGRLDIGAYRVALSVVGYAGPLVADLRSLRDQEGAARRVRGLVEGTTE